MIRSVSASDSRSSPRDAGDDEEDVCFSSSCSLSLVKAVEACEAWSEDDDAILLWAGGFCAAVDDVDVDVDVDLNASMWNVRLSCLSW